MVIRLVIMHSNESASPLAAGERKAFWVSIIDAEFGWRLSGGRKFLPALINPQRLREITCLGKNCKGAGPREKNPDLVKAWVFTRTQGLGTLPRCGRLAIMVLPICIQAAYTKRASRLIYVVLIQ